jgi:hypothetical protein
MAALHRTCLCDGCTAAVIAFKNFPTVTGYGLSQGGVIADLITALSAPPDSVISFDAVRRRWRARGPDAGPCSTITEQARSSWRRSPCSIQ